MYYLLVYFQSIRGIPTIYTKYAGSSVNNIHVYNEGIIKLLN